jgi:hypothetical protein
MDTAYISAFAALAGSLVGGLTSVATSWLSQYVQLRARQQTDDLNRREDLYKQFIDEGSRLYADALEHNEARLSNLIELYSLISMMRVLSSPRIVAHAEKVVRDIVETYLAPNRTFRDVTELLDHDMDPLRDFSHACREELRTNAAAAPLQQLALGPEEPARRAPRRPIECPDRGVAG